MSAHRLHVLLLGPRIIADDFVGGAKISFERLVTDLRQRNNVTLTIVSTSRGLKNRTGFTAIWLNLMTFVRTLSSLWRHAASAHVVVWNVSPRGAVLSGSFIWLLCRLRQRPLLVRVFGSSLRDELAAAPAIVRFIANRTFLGSDLLLLQTKQLVAEFGPRFRTAWFPTTRHMPPRRREYRASCRRLLFLGHLRREKGLPELLAAAKRFPPMVTLSIVGPATPEIDPSTIDATQNAAYGGSALPEEVPRILEAHDALLLPSRLEGYPGVVMEAFQMGLPVIASALPAVRELVTDGEDGLLVDVGSVEGLVEAVARVTGDDLLFQHLRAGALTTGERFRSDLAAVRLEALCRDALLQRKSPCAAS